MLSPYRAALDLAGAKRLFLSALIARLPQGMASLATLLLVRQSTHSYAAAGVAVGAQALATAFASPWLGRRIDRLGRARVLMRCATAYALLLAMLVAAAELHAGVLVLVVLSGAAGALVPPVAPAVRALLREAFSDGRIRERAYALESVAQELIWICGPLLVAILITLASPALALAAIGVECMLGTALFVRAPLARDRARPERPDSRRAALASRTLRVLLVPVALNGVALGATEVGLPALALHTSSRSAAGLLLALWSVGSMLGGLWYGARAWRASLSSRYSLLLVLSALSVVPLAAAGSLVAAVPLSLLAGVAIAPVFSCQYALVGHAVTAGSETEAFTWVVSALVAGIAAGSALGGVLVAGAGVSAPFVFASGALSCAAAIALLNQGVEGRPASRSAASA